MTTLSKIFRNVSAAGLLILLCMAACQAAKDRENLPPGGRCEVAVIQNDHMALTFDRKTGSMQSIDNKLSGETYSVRDDEFRVEAIEFQANQSDAKLVGLEVEEKTLKADYQIYDLSVQVRYVLRNHFAEKQMTLTSPKEYGLKKLILSRPRFSGTGLNLFTYHHPKLSWEGRYFGGIEEINNVPPSKTFFGRTSRGGFFTGIELAFDDSSQNGTQVVLGYSPSLKIKAREKLESEPAYFGVYRKDSGASAVLPADLPLRCESDAMVAMTSAILGPPRFGLVPFTALYQSETDHFNLTPQTVANEMKILDVLAECGIDWVGISLPWGGEYDKVRALVGDQKYVMGELPRRFLDHARTLDIKVCCWMTVNNVNPWALNEKGWPFRPDKPEWQMPPRTHANCLGCEPFRQWIHSLYFEQFDTGYYRMFGLDGDFFGGPGWDGGPGWNGAPGPNGEPGEPWVHPARCESLIHDHLPGDANYACQRTIKNLLTEVRQRYPNIILMTGRPFMDMGIWALKNVDVCFTLHEVGTGESNLASGDQIRTWSRIRVLHHFFPHYIDWPILFPARLHGPNQPPNWPKDHFDYILHSALSSSLNLQFFLPALSGFPDADKACIRRWLDWGRENVECLKVRKIFADWPAADHVDGSAHILNDRGIVFLFNPGKEPRTGSFVLSKEEMGLSGQGTFVLKQEYPAGKKFISAEYGEKIHWEVPAESSIIIRVAPSCDKKERENAGIPLS